VEHEVNHSPLSNAEMRNEGRYTSAPPVHVHGVDLYVGYVCTNFSSLQVS